jgi:alpha-glucosidase
VTREAGAWWKHGVFYQIYPRSFMDANGDGVGDLPGIRRRLDHLAWLGVDALWLSPCFPSPMADFGYDVADYCDIDPLFGSLADLDRLVADAHARGLRLILDWVPNHSSDRHPWFVESRASRTSPKRDWYVWRDPKADGSPPNNWQSAFGGPAWEWDAPTQQFYLHSFLKEQPDLDWRNPEVVAAMHHVLRFWLERGVDGFRIDVIQRIAKDPALRDNPMDPRTGAQRHIHDENHRDVHEALRALRKLVDSYGERMMVGEVYLMDPAEVARYYGRGDELHLAFNFSFLRSPWDAAAFRREIERFEAVVPPEGWPDWVLSNHDVSRHRTRYDHAELGDARARVAALLLLTLRGTPFLYYGEEIGMRDVEIPPERIQDPIARTLHPRLGRDPERTPMLWSTGAGAGFSTGDPWLPIGAAEPGADVESQRADRRSLLWFYRDLLALRRAEPALHRGDYRSLEAPEGVLVYERRAGAARALVTLDLAGAGARLDLGPGAVRGGLRSGPGALPGSAARLELEPGEGMVLLLAQG